MRSAASRSTCGSTRSSTRPELGRVGTSALALLRTLESDHSRKRLVADRLILHCGGQFLGLELSGCPIGVDWSVTHLGGRVRLDEVVKYPTIYVGEAERFPELVVELSDDELSPGARAV